MTITTHAREHRVQGDYRDQQAGVDWVDAIAGEFRRDRVGSER